MKLCRILGTLVLCQITAVTFADEADLEVIFDARANTSINLPLILSRSISADEIRESGKLSINEVFEDLLKLRMTGDSVGSGILGFPDLGGYGETAFQNTLILLNGRRLNNPTLEKPNISTIPISAISRIDVFPGGSGVLFGNGAVGGVINIVTNSSLNVARTDVNFRFGSFGYVSSGASITAPLADQSQFSAMIETTSKDGYRHNTDYDNNFGQLSYGKQTNKHSWITTFSHGLQERKDAGAALQSLVNADRKTAGSTSILDIREETASFDSSTRLEGAQFGIHLGYRSSKQNGTNTSGGQQKIEISSISLNRTNLDETNILGMDLQSGSYYAPFYKVTSYQDIAELFWRNRGSWNESVALVSGARLAYVDDEMSNSSQKEQTLAAAELDLIKKWAQVEISMRADRSFRYANMDENRNSILNPQISNTITFSMASDGMSGRLFSSRISNEIIYDSVQSANVNIPNTSRAGFEAVFETQITPNLNFDGRYSNTRAKIESGSFNGKRVPDVPNIVCNFGFTWDIDDHQSTSFGTYYVSSKHPVSDYDNSLDKSDAYYLSNFSYSFKSGELTATLALNNVFDEDYDYYQIDYSSLYVTPAEPSNLSFQVNYAF